MHTGCSNRFGFSCETCNFTLHSLLFEFLCQNIILLYPKLVEQPVICIALKIHDQEKEVKVMLDLKFNFKLQISLDVFNGKDEWHFKRNSKLC